MLALECDLFRAADTNAVVALLAGAFCAADPPAVAMQLSRADVERFVSLLCSRADADGLSVVARDGVSGEVAGVLLTDDLATPAPIDPGDFDDNYRPVFALLDSLDEAYKQGRSIRRGAYLHLFMLGVDERFARRGIAQRLVTACLANGRAKGYTRAVTEATGVVSQHVFRKLGFTERLRASYREFQYEGRAVFASIRGHDATILMDRAISCTD